MAAEKGQVYKCEVCGNVVAVMHGGDGDLVCCGENMKLVSEVDAQQYWTNFQRPGSP